MREKRQEDSPSALTRLISLSFPSSSFFTPDPSPSSLFLFFLFSSILSFQSLTISLDKAATPASAFVRNLPTATPALLDWASACANCYTGQRGVGPQSTLAPAEILVGAHLSSICALTRA